MPKNLLVWPELDSTELRLLLQERIGGTGQTNVAISGLRKFYLPMAGPPCRVAITFSGKRIVAIEPGEAFDDSQWTKISEEIEKTVLTGPTKVGRDFSFTGRRVTGSWRGGVSGVQILPPPSNAPSAPVELADHPFILEFPLMVAGLGSLTDYRRLRKHRDLTLLLNVLLVGGASSQGFRSRHFWASVPTGLSDETKWVPESFSAKLGLPIIGAPSAPAAAQLDEVAPEEYYAALGHDGGTLRVPANLDQSICS